MADRYWVGDTGNWSDSTNHWATASGGAPAVGNLPTSSDNVIFDANSNTGTAAFSVLVDGSVGTPSVCNDFSTGGAGGALDGVMTLTTPSATQGFFSIYGSLTFPAANFNTALGGIYMVLTFAATSAGKTITTNGVTLNAFEITFNGVGGGWTLGSGLTLAVASNIFFRAGTFNTGNFPVTSGYFSVNIAPTSACVLNLGSSTITSTKADGFTFVSSAFLTFNAGTSTLVTANVTSGINIFAGGGLTFYGLSIPSNGGTAANFIRIAGANTFNNITAVNSTAASTFEIQLYANQIINGAFTLTGSNGYCRISLITDALWTQRTVTLNGSTVFTDVDFRDIVTAGTAGTWTGTRLGNAGNTSGITFAVAKTVYWNLAGSQTWQANAWATTNTGAPALTNFPLPQDTATFTEAGAVGTVTTDQNYNMPNIQMADGVSNRVTAFTFAGSGGYQVGSVTLFSGLVLTRVTSAFYGNGSGTLAITSAGVTFPIQMVCNTLNGTLQIKDNLTITSQFSWVSGTIDFSYAANLSITCSVWVQGSTAIRSFIWGTTGAINASGGNTTAFSCNGNNLTTTGTSRINLTYAGAVGTRSIVVTPGFTESNALNVYVTAGTDIITFSNIIKNLDFTGFSGIWNPSNSTLYGNLTISPTMTMNSGGVTLSILSQSSTQLITTSGKTFGFGLTIGGGAGPGGIVQFQDALTMGATSPFGFVQGTLQFKAGTTNVMGTSFATTGSTLKYLASSLAGTKATISQASGTVTATFLNIKDSNATGGATWNAKSVTNVNAGNNTGWLFAGGGNMFMLF